MRHPTAFMIIIMNDENESFLVFKKILGKKY